MAHSVPTKVQWHEDVLGVQCSYMLPVFESHLYSCFHLSPRSCLCVKYFLWISCVLIFTTLHNTVLVRSLGFVGIFEGPVSWIVGWLVYPLLATLHSYIANDSHIQNHNHDPNCVPTINTISCWESTQYQKQPLGHPLPVENSEFTEPEHRLLMSKYRLMIL